MMFFNRLLSLLISVSVLINLSIAIESPLKKQTTVLYDGSDSQYSKLISRLENFKYEVSLVNINATEEANGNSHIRLFSNGFRLVENLLILPINTKKLPDNLSSSELIQFVNDGGNIMVFTTPENSQTDVIIFLNELGIYPSPKNYGYIDYHSNGADIRNEILVKENKILSDNNSIPKIFNSILSSSDSNNGQKLSISSCLLSNNKYLFPVLQGSETSFSTTLKESIDSINSESTWSIGKQGYLITGFQALNNARILWSGIDQFLNDDTFEEEIVDELIKWCFQIKGLIRAGHIHHAKLTGDEYGKDEILDGKQNISNINYKIKDMVSYEIGLSTWDGEKWTPFKDVKDLQLEFIMLDPYYRLNLSDKLTESEDGEYELYGVQFRVPDQHGMFTFGVDYQRSGLSYISESNVVPIRHLANDEYPRSWEITNSWVYITSAVSVVAAWFIFSVVFVVSGKRQDQIKKNN
ncbi:hypothetical protein B5S33_g4034 [[Candida] boidinii]|nr:hypothetical protein B5S30_g3224 [[Candida] boidinii]OWB85369.1 hypothetical protein B5S33_g4034 [[Candida] boidinii]